MTNFCGLWPLTLSQRFLYEDSAQWAVERKGGHTIDACSYRGVGILGAFNYDPSFATSKLLIIIVSVLLE